MSDSRATSTIDQATVAACCSGPWFHNLHLPDGTQTAPDHPLGDFPRFKWIQIAPHIPADLTGWRVLDIGCNAGFYSFELAKRGAHVLGIDVEPLYLDQAHWAARQFSLEARVRFEHMQVYDIAHLNKIFDLVWFMGVFYHLRYPLLGLDLAAEKASQLLVFQSLTIPGEAGGEVPRDLCIDDRTRMLDPAWPKMAFIEHRLADDPTNWWAPNEACIEAMLRSSGLSVLSRPGHEIYVCEPLDERERGEAAGWVRTERTAATGRPWR